MKPLCEIANEYERNIPRLIQHRDKLRAQAAQESSMEQRRRLRRQIWMVEDMIYESSRAVRVMRGEIRG